MCIRFKLFSFLSSGCQTDPYLNAIETHDRCVGTDDYPRTFAPAVFSTPVGLKRRRVEVSDEDMDLSTSIPDLSGSLYNPDDSLSPHHVWVRGLCIPISSRKWSLAAHGSMAWCNNVNHDTKMWMRMNASKVWIVIWWPLTILLYIVLFTEK